MNRPEQLSLVPQNLLSPTLDGYLRERRTKTVRTISIKAPMPSAFNTDVSPIVATTALNTTMDGTPSYDNSENHFSCTLKCHYSNEEIYSVRFARGSATLSVYEDHPDRA